MDVGGDRGAVFGDGAAARCPGALHCSRATVPIVLRAARRHDGYSFPHQQLYQLRAVLHYECPLQADIRPSTLAVHAARRESDTPPLSPLCCRRRQGASDMTASLTSQQVGTRKRTCQETDV